MYTSAPNNSKQNEVTTLKNAPRFPQGKAISIYNIPQPAYVNRPESVEKMKWATEQVYKVLRLESNHRLAITVTNFDANPSTMKHWLNKACYEMFKTGNRHLAFSFRGSRRMGTLYVQMVYGRKPVAGRKGGVTQS
mgnify:FL=1